VPITTILAILIRDYLRLKEMAEEKINNRTAERSDEYRTDLR